jgi:hypothetical protein
VRLRVPLLRELAMLTLGSVGMARELFWVPPAELNLVRVGICMVLMIGPAAAMLWLRGKASVSNDGEPSSPSSASRL